jgi:hypothetical protein
MWVEQVFQHPERCQFATIRLLSDRCTHGIYTGTPLSRDAVFATAALTVASQQ